MYKFRIDKSEYFDFTLTDEGASFNRNINDYKLIDINVGETLCATTKKYDADDLILSEISLTGYDNFFIDFGDGAIDPDVQYVISSGDTFCFHAVSGFTGNFEYDIEQEINYTQLNGGFYQGFFKLHNYPVEFLPNRMRKGWTINMMLHFPIIDVSGNTLNNVFGNDGFVFYLGTRAENKFSDLTDVEVQVLKDEYNITIADSINLYTVNYYKLNDQPYTGYYNVYNGIPYSGRTYNEETSARLEYNDKFINIIDNAFGVRIKNDGRVGYRTIYRTDPCYTGETQIVSGITNDSFIDYSDADENFTVQKIITKYFTIEDSYTKNPVLDVNNESFKLLTVTFERDVEYDNECLLKYGDYKNGTLSILLNGNVIYKNKKFSEIIPHELDTDSKYQEGVPFNISFGGGTQGLLDALYLDPDKTVNVVLDKFFAGTFTGGISFIQMYSAPLYVTEVREIIKNNAQIYGLSYLRGGRRVYL